MSNPAPNAIRTTLTLATRVVAILVLAAFALGQGVDVKPGAHVLFGSHAATSRPASIDFKRVSRATPEWKTIRAESVQQGSGRYDLLIAEMNKRIRRAVIQVAEAEKRDCVIRRRDIKDARGLTVQNVTKAVIRQL